MLCCRSSFGLLLLVVSVFAGAVNSPSPTLSSLPTAAQSSISAVMGRDLPQYSIQSNTGELSTENLGLHYRFNAAGMSVIGDNICWHLALRGYGYRADLQELSPVSPQAASNRVEYRRGSITEWYVNGPVGVEQGFTIAKRPPKWKGGPLTMALALSGNLIAVTDESRTALTLKTKDGRLELSYSGLSAVDADARQLRAWLEVERNQLLLQVDDTAAHYPVTVDPFLQRAELTNTGTPGSESGTAVAIAGNTVVVNGPGSSTGESAVYVFVKPATGWTNMTQTAMLTPSETGGIGFGKSVAISGNTVVVGAPDDNQANGLLGAVYVFVEPASGWVNMTETAKLTASDAQPHDLLGTSVSISGNTIVAATVSSSGGSNGKDYVFVEPVGGWTSGTQTAELTASSSAAAEFAGLPVAIDGDTVVAGGGGNAGTPNEIFVFVRPTGGWISMTQTAVLNAANPEPHNSLGLTMGISGDTVAFGVPLTSESGITNAGTVYVFVKPAGGWINLSSPTAQLTASDPTFPAEFGFSVAVSGTSIVVGAPNAKVGSNTAQGAAYVFVRPASGWTNMTQTAKLTKANGRAFDGLGFAVGTSGTTIVATAPFTHQFTGEAIVFGQ